MTTTLTDAKLEKVFMDTLDKLYEIHALLDEDEVWFDSLAGVEQLEDTARKYHQATERLLDLRLEAARRNLEF